MKRKVLFGILCLLLIGITGYAVEETYIVKFNNVIQTYSENEVRTSTEYASATKEEVAEYIKAGIVEYYELDHSVRLFETVDNKINSVTGWNFDAIKAKSAWDIGCYGNEIKIAIIDSGIYANSYFGNSVLGGYNYLNDTTDTIDNIGHGTYVAGIISADCETIVGISPQAKIVPLKCFDVNQDPDSLIISKAIRDAVDVYKCDVINMSFGIPKSLVTKTLTDAVSYAIEKGCILVASVGNDGQSNVYYPAKYEKVIGVGSIDQQKNLSVFSQRNSTVDVVAPGEDIHSISLPGYKENDGTSFSTPHVSAVAAIAKCIDKNINSDDFKMLLSECCEDLGNAGYDYFFGHGLIDTEKIVEKLLENKTFFLSHITEFNNAITAILYNNSDVGKKLTWIAANYDLKNKFIDYKTEEVYIEPKQKIPLQKQKNTFIKYFVWENMQTLVPATYTREYKKQ